MKGPIVVGGVPGSGTRVVARLLKHFGVYIGADLNVSLDNLWFTLLMKRPDLVDVKDPLALFKKAMMVGMGAVASQDELSVIDAAYQGRSRDVDSMQVMSLLNAPAVDPSTYRFWGFKEPYSVMWVRELDEAFQEMRFVLIVRDGLDMMFSKQAEDAVLYFGERYGVSDRFSNQDEKHRATLRFWANVNHDAMDAGKFMGDRFKVIRFEDLCHLPHEHVAELSDWLGILLSGQEIEEFSKFIGVPETIGRHRQHGVATSDFPEYEDLLRS